MATKLYIGLMSGTSADGIDLALVDFSGEKKALVASFYQPYSDAIRLAITSLYTPGDNEIERLGQLDKHLAQLFANAVEQFLSQQQLSKHDIVAIGNHGQTIRHRANSKPAFTLQIGCNQTLACLTGIRVIGQFREKDIALGGQGAPLVPAVHQNLFADPCQDVFVVNIGGIANLTYLPKNAPEKVLGFDTGPGNALLDEWFCANHPDTQLRYDDHGQWAQSGTVDKALLSALMSDPYFKKSPPKSTGREDFHLAWLRGYIAHRQLAAQDVQATLLAVTATSICHAIEQVAISNKSGRVLLCGGGTKNAQLMATIKAQLPKYAIESTQVLGIDDDSLEAYAFAWLAYAFDHQITGNLPQVTGAQRATVLGIQYVA